MSERGSTRKNKHSRSTRNSRHSRHSRKSKTFKPSQEYNIWGDKWVQISPSTGHHISYSLKSGGVLENYYIRPFELSVDTMQYLVNNDCLRRITMAETDKGKGNGNANGDQYLSIVNFPSIQIEQSVETKHTGRHEGFYYNVYESPEDSPLPSKDELLENFRANKYINNVMVEMETGEYVPMKSTQNIQYVKDAIESIKTKSNATTGGIMKCDLEGIPPEYIFLKEVIDTNGQMHMVVGYPSARTMRQYLDLYDETQYPGFNSIHEDMHSNYSSKFAELFNFAKLKSDPSTPESELIHDPATEIYKFALGNRPYFFKSIIDRYHQLAADGKITRDEAIRFETLFNDNVRQYYNVIGARYLNKPITRLRYTFFILEEDGDKNWIPAIFNIRQLEARHLPILETIEQLIKLEIPHKFGIISDEDYAAGLRYELFHSYYKYVNFFHITTEYLHMMSNFTDYAHNLKDSITLDEIIYSVKRDAELGRPFWANLRIEYKIRDYRIVKNTDEKSPASFASARLKNYNDDSRQASRIASRRSTKKNNKRTIRMSRANKNNWRKANTSVVMSDMDILLMFEDSYATYTFIYKTVVDGSASFKKMRIKANLAEIEGEVLNAISLAKREGNANPVLKTVYSCGGNEYIKLLTFGDGDVNFRNVIRNFVILEDVTFTAKDLKTLFSYNPLVSKQIYGLMDNDKIDMKYFYKTALALSQHENGLLSDKDSVFYNIYHEIPTLVKNFLISKYYNDGLEIYKTTNNQLNCSNRNDADLDKEHYSKCAEEYNIKPDCVINCVYYNLGNCGYNFIEHLDIDSPKKTVFITPYDNTSSNIGNFLDLRYEHLPMLLEIKKLYQKQNNVVFLHRASLLPKYYCLHFHVLDNNIYTRKYPIEDMGMFSIQDLHLNNIINILQNSKDYFKNINYNIII